MDHVLRTIQHVLYSIDHVPRTMEHVLWIIEHIIWFAEHALGSIELDCVLWGIDGARGAQVLEGAAFTAAVLAIPAKHFN